MKFGDNEQYSRSKVQRKHIEQEQSTHEPLKKLEVEYNSKKNNNKQNNCLKFLICISIVKMCMQCFLHIK